MRFDLIVFDWDGTLMDSEARIVDCLTNAFRDVGVDPPRREVARNVIGLGMDEAMQALWPVANEAQRRQVIERYRHHFLVANQTPSALFAGAREVVLELHRRGTLLAVATGKSRRGLDLVLDETGLGAYFHATRCADQTFSKPHPLMLQEILDVLGVRPADALMVGDTEYDMQMASNAGVSALAVCYGVHAADRLLAHRPLGCLASIADLPAWLDADGAALAQSAAGDLFVDKERL